MTTQKSRLLFVLPCAVNDNRGNATTANRIADSLHRRGYRIESVAADSDPTNWPEFDMAIAFHAAISGPPTQAIAAQRKKPFAVVFTGTDLNGKPQLTTIAAVAKAIACIALCNSAARRARDIFTDLQSGIDVIFQAVAPLPYKPGLGLPQSAPPLDACQKLVLVPSGVRDIKDPLRAVKALTPLAELRPDLHLWFVGPELEARCGEALRQATADLSWATWIGEVPRSELLPLMRRADIVLSTSRSEGAAPNSLLEAILAGTPVLATDIPPHKEFPGTAFCFRDDRLLRRMLEAIFDDSETAAREVRKLQEIVRHKHGLGTEQLAWDRLLSALLNPDRPRNEPKPTKLRRSELPKWQQKPKSMVKPKASDDGKVEYLPQPVKDPSSDSPWGKKSK